MIKGFVWVRPTLVEGYVDGDTLRVLIDRGDGDLYRPKKGARLVHASGKKYDAPEMKEEPERAVAAMRVAEQLCPVGTVVATSSHMLDVYGRPLISVKLLHRSGLDLADLLVEMGHVKTAR